MGGNGGGDCPNLSQPVCLCRHRGGTSGGVGCSLSGWQVDWLANPALKRVVGGLVSHLCYDLHGCQSQWQTDKFLAELKISPLFKVPFSLHDFFFYTF